jgi:hypothetical protein
LLVALPSASSAQVQNLLEPQTTFGINPGIGWGAIVAMSDDGQQLLFDSKSDSITFIDSNGVSDLFVYDNNDNTVTIVTIGPNGGQTNLGVLDGAISGDGKYVAFSISANALPSYMGGSSPGGIYLRSIENETTIYVGAGRSPSLSSDGRYLAFESSDASLVANDTNSSEDIFVYDRVANSYTLVSRHSDGTLGNGDSYGPFITPDGSRIAYTSEATNLIDSDAMGVADAYVSGREGGSTYLAAKTTNSGPANDTSLACGISSDGEKVGFYSSASNLTAKSYAGGYDVYLSNIPAGSVTLVSQSSGGSPSNDSSSGCTLSSDANFMAFFSDGSNLVDNDKNGREDLFLRNLNTGKTSRINVSSSGHEAQDRFVNSLIDISADGRFISYSSWAALRADGAPHYEPDGFVTTIDPDVPGKIMYGFWNGFLDMTNVLELVNKSPHQRTVYVTMRGIYGSGGVPTEITLAPRSQYDVILNDLDDFTVNSYGVVEVREKAVYAGTTNYGAVLGGSIDAKVFYYRNDSVGGFEFAYGLPIKNPIHGNSTVAFNTYQPSGNIADSANPVFNWLSIVNFSNENAVKYRVNRYSITGDLLDSVLTPEVANGGERIDIDGGHGSGPSQVGYVEIIPNQPNEPYVAFSTRYGSNGAGGYDFAFPLFAQKATSEAWVGISSGGGGQNWAEIQNVTTSAVRAMVVAHDNNGNTTYSELYKLAPRSGTHINASALVPGGLSGALHVYADIENSLSVQSMFYFRDSAGNIEAMYGTQSGETIGGTRWGSWNLFLGMSNWLRLFNMSPNDGAVQITVYNGNTTVYDETISIDALSGFDRGLHETNVYGTNVNNYGLVKVTAPTVMTQLLRLKPVSGTNQVDFTAPTPVRR